MEAVYFAFGLLAVALVIGIVIKRFLPQAPSTPEIDLSVPAESTTEVTSPNDDFKHITALRESVASQELNAGASLLSSGVSNGAHENIRQSVLRLQSLSGSTPTAE